MAYGMAIVYSFANVKMLVPVKIPGEFFNFKYMLGLRFSFLESLLICRILSNSLPNN